jgi:LPS sulfotransferase NodH
VAGRPAEYFLPEVQINLAEIWGVTDSAGYLDGVLRTGSTRNGVFAVKLMFTYMDPVIQGLRDLRAPGTWTDVEVLESFFPRLRFVWLYRDDVVAQGVSWAKAVITNEWIHGDRRKRSEAARFNFPLIHRFVWLATRLQMLVRHWFAFHRLQPFLIRYEDLAARPDAITRGLLHYLGIPAPNKPIVASVVPQSDARNLAWAARYRLLARSLPQGMPALTDPLPAELEH